MKTKTPILFVSLILSFSAMAQPKVFVPDLATISNSEKWTVYNREANFDGHVYLNAKAGDGLLYLKDVEFKNGKIELDIKGKNNPGRSFVGVAFHGLNHDTFDAIYFRPFNFENPQRNTHSVQYISMPEYDWSKLRKEHPGKYENTVSPVPDPNDWFHATIVVHYPEVKVFVNDSKEPSLVVDQISTRKSGWLGFWVGNGADGNFKNLKIITEQE